MALPRIDEICQSLQLEFTELPTCVADMQLLVTHQTDAQENAAVADKNLLLVAICLLSQWTMKHIASSCRLSQAECVKYLAQLDRIGIIELKPLNRYRLMLAKFFRWWPYNPVMHYFRDNDLLDYFAGDFEACISLRSINPQL